MLCNANWLPRNLVLLCALLRDVSSLSQSEWDYATDTIVMKFDDIEPDEMPATVFQLLLISKGLNGSKILSSLSDYYINRCQYSNTVEKGYCDYHLITILPWSQGSHNIRFLVYIKVKGMHTQ